MTLEQRITLLAQQVAATVNGLVKKSTLAAKGDLLAASATATPVRVAVGADGLILTADSTQAAGVKWAASTASPTVSVSATAPSNPLTGDVWVDLTGS